MQLHPALRRSAAASPCSLCARHPRRGRV